PAKRSQECDKQKTMPRRPSKRVQNAHYNEKGNAKADNRDGAQPVGSRILHAGPNAQVKPHRAAGWARWQAPSAAWPGPWSDVGLNVMLGLCPNRMRPLIALAFAVDQCRFSVKHSDETDAFACGAAVQRNPNLDI